VRPARPPRRTARALGAALLLLGLVAGLPAALIAFAGNPLPERPPTLDGVREALTSPDDGGLFLSALAVLGWLAWASFAVSLLVEAYARVTRRAAPRLPGLGWQQRLAAGLLAALAAVPVATGVASASCHHAPGIALMPKGIHSMGSTKGKDKAPARATGHQSGQRLAGACSASSGRAR